MILSQQTILNPLRLDMIEVDSVWQGWMNSDKHRMHLMAEKSFYVEQTEYGIGYFFDENSEYGHYLVVLIARPGP